MMYIQLKIFIFAQVDNSFRKLPKILEKLRCIASKSENGLMIQLVLNRNLANCSLAILMHIQMLFQVSSKRKCFVANEAFVVFDLFMNSFHVTYQVAFLGTFQSTN